MRCGGNTRPSELRRYSINCEPRAAKLQRSEELDRHAQQNGTEQDESFHIQSASDRYTATAGIQVQNQRLAAHRLPANCSTACELRLCILHELCEALLESLLPLQGGELARGALPVSALLRWHRSLLLLQYGLLTDRLVHLQKAHVTHLSSWVGAKRTGCSYMSVQDFLSQARTSQCNTVSVLANQ